MNARYLKALGVETKPNGYKPTTHSRTVWQSQRWSNDIAAMLLPPQHDFEFADRERQIESSDGMLSCKPAGRTRRNHEQEIRGRDNLRQHAEMGHAQRDLAGATEFL
jgi:hypothetical protein